jgi:hypothetical protein
MEPVHGLAAILVEPGYHRLRVPVFGDRVLQESHLWWSNLVWVVVIGVNLIGRDPQDQIDRVRTKR